MLLVYGNVASIPKSTSWYTVELRSEKTMEGTIKRMGMKIPDIFGKSPVEIFVPIATRDLNRFELKTGNYIFARSPNFEALLKLKKITGIIGLVTVGDSNRPAQAIKIEDSYVQSIIKQVKESFQDRAKGIAQGAFVRIIDGEMRDLCGTVASIHDGKACVSIEIKTKEIIVETPIRNLLNLSHVSKELRVFYYSDLVQELGDSGESYMIREDIHFTEDARYKNDGLTVKKSKPVGRQQTITARIRYLISQKVTKPLDIAQQVVRALKNEELKPPKTLSILHGVIKEYLIKDFFKSLDPSIENYRQVITAYGDQWRFSVQEIADLDPSLDIPMKPHPKEL